MSNYGTASSPELNAVMNDMIEEVEYLSCIGTPIIAAYQAHALSPLEISIEQSLAPEAVDGLSERANMMRRYISSLTLLDTLQPPADKLDLTPTEVYDKRNAENFDRSKMFFKRFQAEDDEANVVVDAMTFMNAAGAVTGRLVDILLVDDALSRTLSLSKATKPDDTMLLSAALEVEVAVHPTIQAVLTYFEDDREQAESVVSALENCYDRMLSTGETFLSMPAVLAAYQNTSHAEAINGFFIAQANRAVAYEVGMAFAGTNPDLMLPDLAQLNEFRTAVNSISS